MPNLPNGCRYPACECTYPDCHQTRRTHPDLDRLLELEAEGIKALETANGDWDYSSVIRWMSIHHGVDFHHAEMTLGAHYDSKTQEYA